MEKYKKAMVAHSKAGEHNDCSVIATSIACRVPYNAAHSAMKMAGRRSGRSAKITQMITAMRYLGCELELVSQPKQPNGSSYTMTTIGKLCKRGYWVAYVNGHVAAVVNGQVEDWSAGTRRKVQAVWKVTVPRGTRS